MIFLAYATPMPSNALSSSAVAVLMSSVSAAYAPVGARDSMRKTPMLKKRTAERMQTTVERFTNVRESLLNCERMVEV
jgi:hypothetical protein